MHLDYFSPDILATMIRRIILTHKALYGYRVFFFGSRVKGSSSPTSDIDIGIEGPVPVPRSIMAKIREDIDGLPTLYTIDFVDFSRTSRGFRGIAQQYTQDIVSQDVWKNLPSTTNN